MQSSRNDDAPDSPAAASEWCRSNHPCLKIAVGSCFPVESRVVARKSPRQAPAEPSADRWPAGDRSEAEASQSAGFQPRLRRTIPRAALERSFGHLELLCALSRASPATSCASDRAASSTAAWPWLDACRRGARAPRLRLVCCPNGTSSPLRLQMVHCNVGCRAPEACARRVRARSR